MLIKLPFLVLALGTTLFVSSISAEPFVDKISDMMSLVQNMGKLGQMLGGGEGKQNPMMTKLMEGLGKVVSKLTGAAGTRSKRSIHSSYMVTKANQTNYQRIEMNRTWDKEHEKQETSCLVKDNEIYWLELVVQALINVMQQMKKVLDGKTIPFKMPKGAYNQTRS